MIQTAVQSSNADVGFSGVVADGGGNVFYVYTDRKQANLTWYLWKRKPDGTCVSIANGDTSVKYSSISLAIVGDAVVILSGVRPAGGSYFPPVLQWITGVAVPLTAQGTPITVQVNGSVAVDPIARETANSALQKANEALAVAQQSLKIAQDAQAQANASPSKVYKKLGLQDSEDFSGAFTSRLWNLPTCVQWLESQLRRLGLIK